MKIALMAPLWETVPPKAYGGTELVVYILCEEFVRRGHEVTLFASGDSKTSATLMPIIEKSMRELKVKNPFNYELQAIAKLLECWQEFDIIHNHMGYQFLPFVNLVNIPIVTTLHGAFVFQEENECYERYKHLPYISISDSQRNGSPGLNYTATVYNGIQVDKYKFEKEPIIDRPYLVFLGRMSQEKGPHLAIQLAKKTGWKLIMAGKVDVHDHVYFETQVKPLIDNKQIIFIGELGHDAKVELLKGAYATIHTVTWPEPFGLVMAESMACGTPVLALNQGSIPEVVKNGVTGYIENDIDSLTKHVKDIEKIDRYACRKHVEENFSAQRMAEGYIATYKKLIAQKPAKINLGIEVSSRINLMKGNNTKI
ncbi:MAG: glycosyl transferase [Candidatus Melainabacteria bacterium GWF2_32_7]|nr:MAG: glycosyl transferase [Candidatus Melainabacteria bacterium GWF2_32_7]